MIAGLKSQEMAYSQEPALQRKKPIRHIGDSLQLKNLPASRHNGEYILLGGNEKFTSNVRYNPRAQYQKKKIPNNKTRDEPNIITPDAPRDIIKRPQKPGMEQVKFDRRKPSDVPCIDVMSSSDKREMRLAQNQTPKKHETKVNNEKPKAKMVSDNFVSKSKSAMKQGHLQYQQHQRQQDKNVNKSTNAKLAPNKSKSPDKSNNTKKAKEVEIDHALQFKAGIKRPLTIKRLSEYQKQFSWQNHANVTPLLAAEQMIHNNCRQMIAPKQSKMSRHSEYQMQYKNNKGLTASNSRTVEALDLVPAGAPPVTVQSDKRLLQQSAIVLPQRPNNITKSEYTTTFQAPCAFNYIRGAWIAPNKKLSKSTNNLHEDSNNTWFREVLELRKRASEYSRRSRGTHFLQSHACQLFAKNAELWDMHSSSGIVTERSKTTSSDLMTDQSTPRHTYQKKSNWCSEEKSDTVTENDLDNDLELVSAIDDDCDEIDYRRHHEDDTSSFVMVADPKPTKTFKPTSYPRPGHMTVTRGKNAPPHLKLTTPAKSGVLIRDHTDLAAQTTPPLFGKPTGDSQYLVDENQNKPFIGEFINNSTNNSTNYVTDEADEVLSCCSSLASETLALAKGRQNFWTKAY